MTRDYSKFFPSTSQHEPQPRRRSTLETYGWQPFFAQQIDIAELTDTPPVRITEVHRAAIHVVGDDIDQTIPPVTGATVGDWLLLNPKAPPSSRVLRRKSILKRRAPGTDRQEQLIAANLDTCFIVTSCNQDFKHCPPRTLHRIVL